MYFPRSLFPLSNHVFSIVCVGYVIGDFLRAFFYPDDLSTSAILISFYFFFLAWLTFFDSLVYYKAYVQQLQEEAPNNKFYAMNDQGINGAIMPAASASSSSSDSPGVTSAVRSYFNRSLDYHLPILSTLGGLAYFLNIFASVGYIISSFISLFMSVGSVADERETDRAGLIFDIFNMFIFSVDACLFAAMCYREHQQPRQLKSHKVYIWANLCNIVASLAYFAFVIWATNIRYWLSREEAAHVQQGDANWYNKELEKYVFKQRSMYLIADCIYLVYAVLLEIGWSYDKVRYTQNDVDRQHPSTQGQSGLSVSSQQPQPPHAASLSVQINSGASDQQVSSSGDSSHVSPSPTHDDGAPELELTLDEVDDKHNNAGEDEQSQSESSTSS